MSTRAVILEARPGLGTDVEALPRLAGDTPEIARINAELDRLDAAAVQSAADCVEMAGEGPGGGWSRSITQPMTGPGFVTLREHLDVYCGGAYPSTSQTAVTYDLAKGQRIDWPAALPGLNLVLGMFEDMPADYVPLVRSAALGAWFSRRMLANPDAEWVEQCRSFFDAEAMAEQGFNIWADAENGGVSVQPELPHVAQACAERATLTPVELQSFSADAGLIAAIEAAKTAGNWAPKEDAAEQGPSA
ncbi:hypothetical protein [Brevundimonas aurifodinae]|uniref:hypothetical protein n=1 Tax=Brevundimonas aurifodinae TaxID=1508312 RepID=UPI0032E4AC5C